MTGTQLATRQNGAALGTQEAHEQIVWDNRRINALKETVAKGCSEAQLELFLRTCMRTNLDPFLDQICLIPRDGKIKIQIEINGFRAIALRSGVYAGEEGPFYCGKDGIWTDTWLADGPPHAAKFVVWRSDIPRPFPAICLYSEFGKAFGPVGKQFPVHHLGIRAATHAYRKAFQLELAATQRAATEAGATLSFEPETREVDAATGEILSAPAEAPALVQERPAPSPERAPAPPTGARRPVAAATVPPAVTAPAPTRREQMATLELGAAIEAGVLEDPEPSTEAARAPDEDPEHAEALRHYVAAANKAAQARLPHLSPAQVQERSTSEIQDQTTLLLDALNAPQAKARR